MRLATAFAIAIAALAVSWIARAQSYESVDSLYGLQISAGGGVIDFSNDAAAHLTTIGGMWDVCLLAGSDQIVGFEAAYTGTVNDFNAVMFDFAPNASIIGTSLEGNFRLQVPRSISEAVLLHVQPYAYVGAGWNNYWLTNQPRNPKALQRVDNMFMLPWGAGAQV